MDKKEYALLTNGMSEEDTQKVIRLIKGSKALLILIEEKITKELAKDMNTDFDTPSWAYKNAYELGYRKGLTKILEYVKIQTF